MKKSRKINKSKQYTHLYLCQCGNIGHQLVIQYYDDLWDLDEKPCAFLCLIITSCGLLHRLKNAIKYVFKDDPVYVQDIVLEVDDVKELKQGLEKFLELHDSKYKKPKKKK